MDNDQGPPYPSILYKYRPLGQYEEDMARLEQIVIDRRIWWSSPSQFNDPFDCASPMVFPRGKQLQRMAMRVVREQQPGVARHERRRFVKALHSHINENFEENFTKEMHEMMNGSSLYSLAEDPKNLLMWAHYSFSHQGVCLGFDVESLLDAFQLIGRVQYSSERPTVVVGTEEPNVLLKKMVLAKSEEWKYEKEWRLIGYKQRRGLRELPKGCLKSVILGANISAENRARVRDIVESVDEPIAIYDAEKDKRFFRLNLVPSNDVAWDASKSGRGA